MQQLNILCFAVDKWTIQNKVNCNMFSLKKQSSCQSHSVSRIKRNSAQCVHHENEQPTIVIWTIVQQHHWLISCWLIMSQQLFGLDSDDQPPQISDDKPAAAEPANTAVHGIKIRWVRRLNKFRNICLQKRQQDGMPSQVDGVASCWNMKLFTCRSRHWRDATFGQLTRTNIN